jgi:hypothetical protein
MAAVRAVQGWMLIGTARNHASMKLGTGWTSPQSGAGGSCGEKARLDSTTSSRFQPRLAPESMVPDGP